MLDLHPLTNAPLDIQVHVAAALLAVALSPLVIWRKRKDRLHKIIGYTWATAMFVTAVSSFFITGMALIGPFGPIHLLSVFTLVGLWTGMRLIWRRDIAGHEAAMRDLAFYALGVAGLFTMLPGRRINEILFGDNGQVGFGLALVVFVLAYQWNKRLASMRARGN